MRTITRTVRVVGVTQDRAWKGETAGVESTERLNIREDAGNAEMQMIAEGADAGKFDPGDIVTLTITANDRA